MYDKQTKSKFIYLCKVEQIWILFVVCHAYEFLEEQSTVSNSEIFLAFRNPNRDDQCLGTSALFRNGQVLKHENGYFADLHFNDSSNLMKGSTYNYHLEIVTTGTDLVSESSVLTRCTGEYLLFEMIKWGTKKLTKVKLFAKSCFVQNYVFVRKKGQSQVFECVEQNDSLDIFEIKRFA